MGIFGSICSGISSLCSSVASGICNAVSGIGTAISSFASGVGNFIAGAIGTLTPVAGAIGKFASAFLQGLGILKPDEQPEDIGDRALQAADKGITTDKFEKFDDYMNALREFPLDPAESEKRNHAEKLMAGMGIGTVGVEKKFGLTTGSLNGMWLLPMTNPDYFTPERMQTLVGAARLGNNVFDYLDNRLTGGEARSFEKSLEVGKDGKPLDGVAMNQLYDALDAARGKLADITRQMQGKDTPAQGE